MKYGYYLKRFWPIYAITIVLFIFVTAGANQAVTTLGESIPIERSCTIIIDAGHGGEDGGATSCTGILESQINLQIALRLRDLCHLLGYKTQMIRTSDVSVYTGGTTLAAKKVSDLKERIRIVNQAKNGILISIHQNTFPEDKYKGAQVFYNDSAESKRLAQLLQSTFVQTINPGSKRKCKASDGIYLMEHIQTTGVLIECGFISNHEEEAQLCSAIYQQKICCVIVSSLSTYRCT